MHGKFLIHAVDGRKIPIVLDAEAVDMTLGTGAVKVRRIDFLIHKTNHLSLQTVDYRHYRNRLSL